ncbi:NAD-dependent epimerase/dehydratase family protein [Pseudomaricurvus alkylphenolicus]|uniref:NAD-dependent epimerase/dehydratase family protein n=1 Tax=Pseudomaricurvus alkylphenolicus TaxID=1306991 RepID=UPI00141FDC6F|nr:NAD-dependent epimerase/dehydratase family protein [Pseudomaricurvus alkylphenolicus]NIB43430.1 NAD-dependent epimerase/dehydratase family protein [Pseudomaricurvus alkylphenolicus]
MRVLIIGANGFVGKALVHRFLDSRSLLKRAVSKLLLFDQSPLDYEIPDWAKHYCGDLGEPALLRRVLADGIDLVFHLASVAGGLAEQDYELGYRVNLQGTLELLQQLRQKPNRPTFVYTSSIAVYGGSLPTSMEEDYQPRPELSYATHKLMIELMLRDLSRRGELDGRSLRVPGIVVRPSRGNGLKSAFMSDLINAMAQGKTYECPVSSQASMWWMSARCCVDNLVHAADVSAVTSAGTWQLPALHLTIGEVINALAERFGEQSRSLIRFAPDESLEALFGCYPPMETPLARAEGFYHDGDAKNLVENVLTPEKELNYV